jgi:ACT domain-containing protein
MSEREPAVDPTPDANAEGAVDADQAPETDGGERPQPHTIRLELIDEPGQLLAALRPIAENGGNLLSIFHERGNLTPRGRIPVEVDIECPPARFEAIVDALREEGVNVVQADADRYSEEVVLLLVGDLVETDLSDTVRRVEETTAASIADLSLSAPAERESASSARIRLAMREGRAEEVVALVRDVATDKGLDVVEPLMEGGQ